ncbi:MAG: PKD domain-containing protein [Gemmatimonadales bacterium]
MRRNVRVWSLIAAGAAWLAAGCSQGESLTPAVEGEPEALTVEAIDMHTVQVSWKSVDGAASYELGRRADLQGDFKVIVTGLPRSQTKFLDRDLDPATIYGYRLTAYDDFGQQIGRSPVAGVATPEQPGVRVSTTSFLGGDPAQSVDSNGYRVVLKGNGINQNLPIDPTGTQLLQPLQAGLYSVGLEDLAEQCTLSGTNPRVVTVTDQGTATVVDVRFEIRCRDRTRGQLTGIVTATGDTSDANGFKLVLSGVADDTTLSTGDRAVVISRDIGPDGGQTVYENIRPGIYSLVLADVSAFCTVSPKVAVDSIRVDALSAIEETFAVDCTGGGGTGDRPFAYRAAWDRDTAPVGSVVRLATTIDVSQDPTVDVRGFQFALQTPTATVRLDSVVPGTAGWSVVPNTNTPGQFQVVGIRTTPAKGVVPLVNAFYTVVGANGTRAATRTLGLTIADQNSSPIDDRVARVEDTLFVGTAGPPPTNQPPVAQANGPYSGNAGDPITFSSAGSTDPDGTIASYAWTFGDDQSGTGASPTHSYSAAGTYQVTLTVTDDDGATAESQATVTVTSQPPPTSTPFTWRATFGSLDPVNMTVPLRISLDLSANIPETAGTEALQEYVVDSLTWDPAVLQYFAFNRTSGTGSVNFTRALSQGVLIFRGTPAAAQSSGVISIATLTLKVIGGAGQTSAIKTYLGSLTGTPATGGFSYRSRTVVEDPTYTVAGGGGPSSTTVSGTVTSPQRGALAGVTVSLGGSLTATTAADGRYTISNVAAGGYTAVVSGLPSGCTAPAGQAVTVGSTAVTGVDFSVTCPAATGVSVSGSVTSPARGALSGVTVTLTPGAISAATNAAGAYVISNVSPGSYTAAVSNLPSGCTAPATQTVAVASTAVTGVDFSVTCTAPPSVGTVSGTITIASGGSTPSLAAVVVTITPAGGSPLTTNPNATGAYSRSGVPTGDGTVALSNLPSGCTGTTSANYTGLTAGGTVTVPPIQLTCAATPAGKYPYTMTWGSVTGGKATVTAKINMDALNDPLNNGTGPDKIGAVQMTLNFPAARLTNASCSPSGGFSGVFNTGGAGVVSVVLTNSTGAGGTVTLYTCTFDVGGSGPTTITSGGTPRRSPRQRLHQQGGYPDLAAPHSQPGRPDRGSDPGGPRLPLGKERVTNYPSFSAPSVTGSSAARRIGGQLSAFLRSNGSVESSIGRRAGFGSRRRGPPDCAGRARQREVTHCDAARDSTGTLPWVRCVDRRRM